MSNKQTIKQQVPPTQRGDKEQRIQEYNFHENGSDIYLNINIYAYKWGQKGRKARVGKGNPGIREHKGEINKQTNK